MATFQLRFRWPWSRKSQCDWVMNGVFDDPTQISLSIRYLILAIKYQCVSTSQHLICWSNWRFVRVRFDISLLICPSGNKTTPWSTSKCMFSHSRSHNALACWVRYRGVIPGCDTGVRYRGAIPGCDYPGPRGFRPAEDYLENLWGQGRVRYIAKTNLTVHDGYVSLGCWSKFAMSSAKVIMTVLEEFSW